MPFSSRLSKDTEGIRTLSSLPGRVRWSIPELRNRAWLGRTLEADLKSHPHVLGVRANAVVGSLLLEFAADQDEERALEWVTAALDRAPEEASDRQTTAVVSTRGEPTEQGGSPLGRLLASTEEYPELRARAVATTALDGLANGVPPLLVSLAVGTIANPARSLIGRLGIVGMAPRIAALGVISGGFWLLAALLEYYRERTASELADRIRRDLRVDLYEHLQGMDVATLEEQGAQRWMAVLDGDVEEVHRFLRHGGKPLVSIAGNIAIVGATFVIVSPSLGLLQLLVIPPIYLASSRMLRPLRERMVEAKDLAEEASGMMAGNLAGMGTLTTFGAEEDQARRVRAANELHLEASREANAVEAVYVPTLRSIVGAGFVGTITVGTAKVFAGKMTLAGLDTMAYGQLRLMSSLARGGTGIEEFQRTSAALERIYETLDLTPSLQEGTRSIARGSLEGEVSFDRVTFGYEADTPVLDGIDLVCPAGGTTGIVGATGAGKSTLLKLLMRFYDPQAGAVRIDGRDIREYRLRELRQQLAVVPQDIVLFSGTVRENIALGKPEATLEEVQRAAEKAEAHDFIEALPLGYDTELGFGGSRLSGGQRQRIAIARALLVDRPLLLFDEATSALDHQTEASIQRSLAKETRGRTTIIVAHRLSTVRHADVIFVLDDGRVFEKGTHEELVASGGVYAGMWKIQTGEAAAPGGAA